jgi:NAD(P)-dependent dehydrogenase (short-subunit alcohol dehydrogenase family)
MAVDAKPRLAGKIALVTGGTRGIGLQIVKAFLAQGARVAFSGASARTVEKAQAELGEGCTGFVAELSAAEAGVQLVNAVLERFGGIDVLINNAGALSGTPVWDVTPEEWDRICDVNLRAVFFTSQAAARSMRSRGGGSIVSVSSIAAQNGGLAGNPAYAAAKAGVIGLTRALARQFAPERIRVNCIAPAIIETDMTAPWPQALRERLVGITPLGRFGAADEVSGAAVFLASEEASFVTGQTLSVNGGAYMN